jgi:hypothetical protein
MESFNFELRNIGIPLTLSSLGNKYVAKIWEDEGYSGYQIAQDYLIGDTPKVQTPTGLTQIGEVGTKLSLFIGNYKGGRNESFMYGKDTHTHWYDYDLTSAYTSILYTAGHPDYSTGCTLSSEYLEGMSDEDLLFNYIIIKCNFNFPRGVKYPSIPVYLDETTTVYPLTGTGFLTGAEYLLARNQKCELEIDEIY